MFNKSARFPGALGMRGKGTGTRGGIREGVLILGWWAAMLRGPNDK